MLDITEYKLTVPVSRSVVCAVVSDLHDQPYGEVLAVVLEQKPEIVLAPGDIIERWPGGQEQGLGLLSALAEKFPVFYAYGNHETGISDGIVDRIRDTGAVLLRNGSVRYGELNIGGMTAEFRLEDETRGFLERYSAEDGVKVLLCHQPDRYFHYVKPYPISAVVSGHAHGGQIRVFGQGLFAPQQGIFPKWTEGVHENRLVVSRGLGNHTIVPRLWNAPEVCFVTLSPD